VAKISLLNLVLDDLVVGTTWSADLVANGLPIATVASDHDGVISVLQFDEGVTAADLFELDDAIISTAQARPWEKEKLRVTLFNLCTAVVSREVIRRRMQLDPNGMSFDYAADYPKTKSRKKIDVLVFDDEMPLRRHDMGA